MFHKVVQRRIWGVVGSLTNKYFPANLLKNLTVKKCENLLRINRITAMSSISPFFEHDVDY